MKSIIIVVAILLFGCKGKQQETTYNEKSIMVCCNWVNCDSIRKLLGIDTTITAIYLTNGCYDESGKAGVIFPDGKYPTVDSITFSKDIKIINQ